LSGRVDPIADFVHDVVRTDGNVHAASGQGSRLLDQVAAGEEVILPRSGRRAKVRALGLAMRECAVFPSRMRIDAVCPARLLAWPPFGDDGGRAGGGDRVPDRGGGRTGFGRKGGGDAVGLNVFKLS
jgi:hypothetical protein